MRNSKVILPVFVLANFLFCSCTKEDLPPLSYSGKNIFACYINDKLWIAEGYTDFGTATYVPGVAGGFWPPQSNLSKYDFYLSAQQFGSTDVELYIKNERSDKYISPGKYLLNTNSFGYQAASAGQTGHLKNYAGYYFQTTGSLHKGWIEIIKVDTINGIISGRFEFDLPDFKIREGRFDVKD